LSRIAAASFAALLSFLFSIAATAQSPGPQDAEGAEHREQVWRIPATAGTPLMVATVMRPPGEARRPLVVINHGTPPDDSQRPKMRRPRFPWLSSWFVERGYVVVLPQRPSYGATGGNSTDDYGSCQNPDYRRSALGTAGEIKAVIDYMRNQPFVAPDRTIVVGHSTGGWGALAIASLNSPGVSGVINFAGGRGGQHFGALGSDVYGNCSPSSLVSAAATLGTTARVPSLWIYAENDSYFRPDLVRRMADAYRAGGAPIIFIAAGRQEGGDGHDLMISINGPSVWSAPVAQFLTGLK
jgi:dienelactone hydrolase